MPTGVGASSPPRADGTPHDPPEVDGTSSAHTPPRLTICRAHSLCGCPAMRRGGESAELPIPWLRFSSTRATTEAAAVPPPSEGQRSSMRAAVSGEPAPASMPGLASYFCGLAAGDELEGLVRGLRSSMWTCYQDCHRAGSRLDADPRSLPTSTLSSSTATAKGMMEPMPSASLSPRSSSACDSSAEVQVAVTAPAVHIPSVPAPLPPGTLPAAERRRYWAATKAALLFAAESPAAAEEATTLHCSPVARSLLYHYYYPSASGSGSGVGINVAASPSSSRRRQAAAAAAAAAHGARMATRSNVAASFDAAPAMSTLQPSDMRWVLSDTRVVELAKEALRGYGNKEGWQRALALLRQVEPTPLTSAVELQLYRHTDGQHWAAALACLSRIPPALWTEMDVSAAVRSLYAAGRRHCREYAERRPGAAGACGEGHTNAAAHENGGTAEPAAPFSASLFLTRLTAHALRIHKTVETTSAVRWVAPSAFNDTLGLVAFDAAGWQDACALLDKLLAGAREPAPAEGGGDAALSTEATAKASAPMSALVEEEASAAVPPSRVVVRSRPVEDSDEVVSVFFDSTAPTESSLAGTDEDPACASASGVLRGAASPAPSLYAHVRANAVTLHQTCRAFRGRWDVGLRYVELLNDTFGDTLGLLTDTPATEDVLRLCIAGQRWETALQLVTAHQKLTAGGVLNHSGGAPAVDGAEPRGYTVGQATQPQQRPPYRPDVFVEVVRLLGSAAASRSTACDLIRLYAPTADSTRPTASPMSPPPLDATVAFRSSLGVSKHYNTNTLSRAYNCLVQNAEGLADADAIIAELQSSTATQADKGHDVEPPGGAAAEAVSVLDERLAGLETESVAHVALLSAVAGDWQRALHHTNALLHKPRFSTTFFPTARLHDAVQYALEQAPPPGAPWQVSLQLFTDMMERNVPSSEVSFQSAVKRCFAGGVPEQAQRLFHITLRYGVR